MIQHNEAYQSLLAAIEADQDDALPKLVMADWLGENAYDDSVHDLAYACRWCAEKGKWPYAAVHYPGEFWWVEYEGEDDESRFWKAIIEEELFITLKGNRNTNQPSRSYHSAHDAIADLARVLKMQGEHEAELVRIQIEINGMPKCRYGGDCYPPYCLECRSYFAGRDVKRLRALKLREINLRHRMIGGNLPPLPGTVPQSTARAS